MCSDDILHYLAIGIAYKNTDYPFLKQDNQVVLLLSERSHSDSPGRSWMVMLQTQSFSFMPLSRTPPVNIYSLQKMVVIILVFCFILCLIFWHILHFIVASLTATCSHQPGLRTVYWKQLILCRCTHYDLTLPFLLNGK